MTATRDYYYCSHCEEGLFPLDHQLGVPDTHWSEAVAREAVWLNGQVESDLAEQILQKIGGWSISDTSLWRRAKRWGEKIRVAEQVRAQAAVGLPQRGQVVQGQVPHERPTGTALDGGCFTYEKKAGKSSRSAPSSISNRDGNRTRSPADEQQDQAVHIMVLITIFKTLTAKHANTR